MLFKAAEELDKIFPGIWKAWKSAWFLHVYGFHEMSLNKEIISVESNIVKTRLFEILRSEL